MDMREKDRSVVETAGSPGGVAALEAGSHSPNNGHPSAPSEPAKPASKPAPKTLLETPHPYPGRLIAVEGIDGSGKSTQLLLLERWMRSRGYPVHFTEWNSSRLVRHSMQRGKKKNLLTPTTFSLLHAVDFDISLERLLSGRAKLKYHEAGMDVGLSADPVESFRMFQSRVLEIYDQLTLEFEMRPIDAAAEIPDQQKVVRTMVQEILRDYDRKRANGKNGITSHPR
jgi:thymidylate kinase